MNIFAYIAIAFGLLAFLAAGLSVTFQLRAHTLRIEALEIKIINKE